MIVYIKYIRYHACVWVVMKRDMIERILLYKIVVGYLI